MRSTCLADRLTTTSLPFASDAIAISIGPGMHVGQREQRRDQELAQNRLRYQRAAAADVARRFDAAQRPIVAGDLQALAQRFVDCRLAALSSGRSHSIIARQLLTAARV